MGGHIYRIFILVSVLRPNGMKLLQRSNTFHGLRHHIPKVCTQPPIATGCQAGKEAWYFSGSSTRCVLVPKVTCIDGGNSFPSQSACQRTCQRMNGTRTNICNMVSKRTCGEKYYAWYFDYHDKHCKMVSHIACTGKITVFPTEKKLSVRLPSSSNARSNLQREAIFSKVLATRKEQVVFFCRTTHLPILSWNLLRKRCHRLPDALCLHEEVHL
uniref:Pancreatic trypsin inhibitor n=1 Tax=Rhipicephalus zambeziensis TaxID=60191 RepID=A0A224Y8C7_9ACAR